MNTFISPTWVTTDTAMFWKNNITLVRRFDRQWNNEWTNKPGGAKIGYTVQIRLPQRWVVTEGQALVQQAILNQTVPATLNHQFQVGMGWSSADSALLVEEVQDRYTSKAGKYLANKCDVQAGLEVFRNVYFQVGPTTPSATLLAGLNPNVTLDGFYTDAVAKLRNVGVPDELCAVIDPQSQSNLLKVAFNQFNPQNQVSKYFTKGQFSGPALGVDDWYWDPNIPTFTTGNFTTSTWLVDGASQTGSTILLKGGGVYNFVAGDTFYIAGVNAVNPLSYVDTGNLQAFSITSAISGSGGALLTVTPAIIPLTTGPAGITSPLATVTAAPANNALVTFVTATGAGVNATMSSTTSRQSLIFHDEAFAFVMAELPVPLAGANSARKSDADARLSMRWVEQYNIQTDQEPSKIECLVGYATVLPYFALRAWS